MKKQPFVSSLTLYHVTPSRNVGSIAMSGIEPILATGKQQLSWYVERSRLLWAIAHCSARHHLPVNELTVFEMPANYVRNLRRTAWRGVWCSPCVARPINHRKAEEYVATPDNVQNAK